MTDRCPHEQEDIMNAADDQRGPALHLVLGWMALACIVLLALCGPHAATATAARWAIQPTPSLGGGEHGDLVSVSCTSASSCTAVGYSFRSDVDVEVPLVERWDGEAWTAQPPITVPRGELYGVSCTTEDACTAVGEIDERAVGMLPLAERWNGITWSRQRTPGPHSHGQAENASLNAVSCTSATACTAVGSDDAGQLLAERWNGSKWSIQRTPLPSIGEADFEGVSCPSQADCTAVGTFQDENAGCGLPLVERWSDGRWSIRRGARLPGCDDLDYSGFNSVSCASASACTAVGEFDRQGQDYSVPLVEAEHGRRWSVQPNPDLQYLIDPWGGDGYLSGVTCTSASVCIATGIAGSPLRTVPIVERETGPRWQLHGGAPEAPDGGLLAISCTSSAACTAVGFNDSLGAYTDAPLVQRLS